MRSARGLLALLGLLLALAGCSASLTSFTVPAQVWAGQVFEVVLAGTASYNSGATGEAGAILQLPAGFQVEGAVAQVSDAGSSVIVPDGGRRDHPLVLALIAPEPGHLLASFSGIAQFSTMTSYGVQLKVYLRAPRTIGSFVLKAVVGGSTSGVWQLNAPAGVTSFAAVSTAPFVQTVTTVADPQTPFALETGGLLGPGGPFFGAFATGDVDGDGNDDLGGVQYGTASNGNHLWLSRPGSTWSPVSLPPAAPGSNYARITFADFDRDGHIDLADTTGRVLYGDGGATWTPGPPLPLLMPPWNGVATGDIDGDGFPDLALCTRSSDAVQVFHNEGNRTFTDWSNNLPASTNGPDDSWRIVLADVSGDGICDIVTGGPIGLRIWLGDGQGRWSPANQGLPYATDFVVGDLDRDGVPDLVLFGLRAYEFTAGTWQPRTIAGTPPWMSGPVALLDYDRDGWPDVVTSLFFPGPNIVLLRNLAGQAFAAPQTVAGPILRGYSNYGINDLIDLASGDFDGDSWPDLVVTASGEHPLVWRNNGSGLSPYAGACGAAGFPTPRTTGSGLLQLGSSTFALELQGATPNAPGALWIGLSKRFAFGLPLLPFDLAALGAPGCAVVASAEAPFFVVADAQGRAAVPLAIPNDPALRRFTVFAQCAAAAPGSNAMGWLFGNGLAAKIP